MCFFVLFFSDCSLSILFPSVITSSFFLSDSSRCRPDAGLRTYVCIPSPSQTHQLCTSQHLSYIWRCWYLHCTGDAAFLSVCVRAAVWVCVLEAPRDNPEMSSHTSLGSNSGSSAQCGCASILHSPRQNTKKQHHFMYRVSWPAFMLNCAECQQGGVRWVIESRMEGICKKKL